jgi:alkylated DNA repair dioxygenase AlkB
MQDLFADTPIEIHLKESSAILFRNILTPERADLICRSLRAHTPWKQDKINYMGKVVPVPRLAAWYSKTLQSYFYSGIKVAAHPYTNLITELNNLVESATGCEFNSVLVNLYRDGNDSVSWHADDEPSLGRSITIGSLSFGESRDFQLKRKDGHGNTITIELDNGSLLLMKHPTQRFWLHQIPKRKNIGDQRINLTFRYLV